MRSGTGAMVASRPPRPGAVATIAAGGSRGGKPTGFDPRAAFAGEDPEVFSDDRLTIAWRRSRERRLHVDETALCFIEGALYEPDGPEPAAALASAYARGGERMLVAARGEYWALLWDRRAQRGVVVTDHMACRAPYWFADGADLVVASEVRDLLRVLPRRPEPD